MFTSTNNWALNKFQNSVLKCSSQTSKVLLLCFQLFLSSWRVRGSWLRFKGCEVQIKTNRFELDLNCLRLASSSERTNSKRRSNQSAISAFEDIFICTFFSTCNFRKVSRITSRSYFSTMRVLLLHFQHVWCFHAF